MMLWCARVPGMEFVVRVLKYVGGGLWLGLMIIWAIHGVVFGLQTGWWPL